MDENLKKVLMNIPPDKLEALLEAVEKNTGKSKDTILSAAKEGAGSDKLNSLLGKVDSKKVEALLKDKAALDALLATPKARMLINTLLGGK